MIGKITGLLAYKSPLHLIVDVGGIGYRVFVTLQTFYKLPGENDLVSLHIHTHVRDDALHLYGFLSPHEKEAFEHLLNVSKIGPKLALNILSGITVRELKDAIAKADVARLNAIPGVGLKTAERLILELRDKLANLALEGDGSDTGALSQNEKKLLDDAASALINLGYKKGLAEAIIKKAFRALGDEATMELLIRESLKQLSKSG